jgi:drug/metabolite transporter (DMT)-like permease
MTRHTLRADGLLLLAAAIWGAAFVAQRSAMQHIGPLTFNGIRFALGTLVLLPVMYARGPQRDTSARADVITGLQAGLLLFAGATLQQVGLVYTTAGKAGFITGLYVVLVPVFGLVLGQRAGRATWVGIALALVGLYLLSVTEALTMSPGDGLVLFCALVWAVHVLFIGRRSPHADPLRLAATQFAVTAILSLAIGIVREPITVAGLHAATGAILYGGLLSVGVAYTLQVVGQRTAPPAHAGLLLSLEAVFAAIAGAWLLGEQLNPRQFGGCALMLTGIVASQLPRLWPRAARVR